MARGVLIGGLLFIVAFVTPIILIKFKNVLEYSRVEAPWLSFPVKYSKTFFSIETDKLNPVPDKDYILIGTVLFRGLPAPNERQVFLNYTATGDESGIGVALYSDNRELRPSIYFRGAGLGVSESNWYSFQPISVTPHVWTIWAISILNDKIVAVHTSEGCEGDVISSGAIELDNIALTGMRTLKLGSYGNSTFRGALGPFYVINGNRFERGLQELFVNIKKDICRGMRPQVSTLIQIIPAAIKNHTRGNNTDGYIILTQ